MKIDAVRAYAQRLLDAADHAEAEGRETLEAADLDEFVAADDDARRALVEAIEAADGADR